MTSLVLTTDASELARGATLNAACAQAPSLLSRVMEVTCCGLCRGTAPQRVTDIDVNNWLAEETAARSAARAAVSDWLVATVGRSLGASEVLRKFTHGMANARPSGARRPGNIWDLGLTAYIREWCAGNTALRSQLLMAALQDRDV